MTSDSTSNHNATKLYLLLVSYNLQCERPKKKFVIDERHGKSIDNTQTTDLF